MSYFSRYDKGEWSVLCDVCGRKMRSEDLRQRWDGLKVCNYDWEPRQPQDFVRGVADYQAPSWTRPEPPQTYIPVTIIYDDYGQPLFPLFYCSGVPSLTLVVTSQRNQVKTVSSIASVSLNPAIIKKDSDTAFTVGGSSLTLNNITLG